MTHSVMPLQFDNIRLKLLHPTQSILPDDIKHQHLCQFVQVDIGSISHLRRLPSTLQALHLAAWYGHGSRTIWHIVYMRLELVLHVGILTLCSHA
jgi:hypothetical protein